MTYTIFFILTMSVAALMGFFICAILSEGKIRGLENENLCLNRALRDAENILDNVQHTLENLIRKIKP